MSEKSETAIIEALEAVSREKAEMAALLKKWMEGAERWGFLLEDTRLAIEGCKPHSETSKAIQVFSFYDAPAELRALSKHGGDEEGIAVLPPGMTPGTMPWWLERIWNNFGDCEPQKLTDGRTVFIWSHS